MKANYRHWNRTHRLC